MKVNFNSQSISPQFGMALKVVDSEKENVKNYLVNNIETTKDAVKLNQYIESQKNNPMDIYLSTTRIQNTGEEKLKANIGGHDIIEKNPIKAIKKAIQYADKYNNEKLAVEAKSSGLFRIISKLM